MCFYFAHSKVPSDFHITVFFSLPQTLTVMVAIALPQIGAFVSLIGAVCLSMLGLIMPPIIELVTYWEHEGLGRLNWRLWKNCFLICFGIIGFVLGAYVSIEEIKQQYQ